ncbi:MAG: helix-turn-helix transcriptional regulator [Syntrophomonadaceae bacterium]|jgi:transcriptional regulator with XRE-family HTH domain
MQLPIGKNIQKKRKALGLTQEQLATALGVVICFCAPRSFGHILMAEGMAWGKRRFSLLPICHPL